MTHEEVLNAVYDRVVEARGIKLENLVRALQLEFENTLDLGYPVIELVVELLIQGRIVEFHYRLPPDYKLASMIFPSGTHFESKPTNIEMGERAKLRPANFNSLSTQSQWDIDKVLGILDWDGST